MSQLREPLKLKAKFMLNNKIFHLAATDIIDPATGGPIAMIRCYDLAINKWVALQSFSAGPKGQRALSSFEIVHLPKIQRLAYYLAEWLYCD